MLGIAGGGWSALASLSKQMTRDFFFLLHIIQAHHHTFLSLELDIHLHWQLHAC